MTTIDAIVQTRADAVKRSLTRHRLVFLQCGAAFELISPALLAALGGSSVGVGELLGGESTRSDSRLIVTNVESLSELHPSPQNRLGSLRERVLELVDEGLDVCLVSAAPRVAFGNVPGSSLLEDSALAMIPPLDSSECPPSA